MYPLILIVLLMLMVLLGHVKDVNTEKFTFLDE